MIADSIFKPAQTPTHNICQDYCLHEELKEGIRAKLSDGCSSSLHTDIGARIAVHNRWQAKELVSLLGLDYSCLDVTLLTLAVIEHSDTNEINIKFGCIGDGYFAYKLVGNSPELFKIDFEGNIPYYLSHLYFPAYSKRHDEIEGNKRKYSDIVNGTENYIFSNKEDLHNWSYNKNQIEWVAIFSDGLASFRKPDGSYLSDYEVLQEVTRIPVWNGKFLERRINKMFEKYHSEDIKNTDDFSCVLIRI